jgi:hypothetical protein
MSQQSFVHVPQAGFSGFLVALSTGPWALVDTSAVDDGLGSITRAPLPVIVKLRLKQVVYDLLQALSVAGNPRAYDRTWDACQRQLRAELAAAAVSDNPAKRAAAKRLQDVLLLGVGDNEARLRYQEEVDFGRIQLSLAAHGQTEADVALLGLDPLLTEIAAVTDGLATALGDSGPPSFVHTQKAKAVAKCVNVFGWAADTLGWLLESADLAREKELIRTLHGSLLELASRYAHPPQSKSNRDAPPPSVH